SYQIAGKSPGRDAGLPPDEPHDAQVRAPGWNAPIRLATERFPPQPGPAAQSFRTPGGLKYCARAPEDAHGSTWIPALRPPRCQKARKSRFAAALVAPPILAPIPGQ